MRILIAAIGFTIANFAWQAITSQRWGVALERSFFQGVAFAYVWFCRVQP